MNETSQRSKSYRAELHDLVQRGSTDEAMGAMPMRELLLNEAQYCHSLSQNAFTIEHSLDVWLKNFRNNLPKMMNPGMWIAPTDLPVLVVGAGTTARDYDFSVLKKYRNEFVKNQFIICTNKSLSYLLKYGIEPDLVVTLHSTDEILGTFKTDEIKAYTKKEGILAHTKFVVPSTIDPSVLFAIRRITFMENERWFNPAVPDEQVENITQFMERMNGLRCIDTGGNVGILALVIALEISAGKYPVGILGLEHCLPLDDKWSNEQAASYRIEYAPECERPLYAIPPSFRIYLDGLVKLCHNKNVANLSPFGPVYARKLLPYMTLEDFVCQNKE